jgi:hypothetical protein
MTDAGKSLRTSITELLLLMLVLVALFGTIYLVNHQPDTLASVKLVHNPGQPVTLRVAYVSNPRFPDLSRAQQQQVLHITRDLVKRHFDIEVAFATPQQIGIEDFFALRNSSYDARLSRAIVDPMHLRDTDVQFMREGVYDTLSQYWGNRGAVANYARPYLSVDYSGDDFHQLSVALVETLLTRLNEWHQMPAADGRPVLDGSRYSEWVWWDTIGYGNLPFEVVLTNQLVASAEIYEMDVHSCIRGGISGGTTSYNKQGLLKSYSFVTAFPMLNDYTMLQLLRDEVHVDSERATSYIATVLAHELGHMLLHLGHPFGNPHCIMSPTPLLKYREWTAQLDPAQCALHSEPQMTPGAAEIEYRADW